ncbi:hypothetical protein [Massilia phosphatilytica]
MQVAQVLAVGLAQHQHRRVRIVVDQHRQQPRRVRRGERAAQQAVHGGLVREAGAVRAIGPDLDEQAVLSRAVDEQVQVAARQVAHAEAAVDDGRRRQQAARDQVTRHRGVRIERSRGRIMARRRGRRGYGPGRGRGRHRQNRL